MSIRLIIIALVIVLTVSHPAYASGPENYSEFFRGIETITPQVILTDDHVASEFWYSFNEKEIRPPLNRLEIEASVSKAFKEMFPEKVMKTISDATKEEQKKLQAEYEKKHPPKPKPPDADPFDMSNYVPHKPKLIVTVYVVLGRYLEKNGSQFIHGAITVKTYRDYGRRHKDSKYFGENYNEVFPIIFVLPEDKDKASETIMESVKKAYEHQSRWILCTRVEGMSCTESQSEFFKKQTKKQTKSENKP